MVAERGVVSCGSTRAAVAQRILDEWRHIRDNYPEMYAEMTDSMGPDLQGRMPAHE